MVPMMMKPRLKTAMAAAEMLYSAGQGAGAAPRLRGGLSAAVWLVPRVLVPMALGSHGPQGPRRNPSLRVTQRGQQDPLPTPGVGVVAKLQVPPRWGTEAWQQAVGTGAHVAADLSGTQSFLGAREPPGEGGLSWDAKQLRQVWLVAGPCA